MDQRGKTRGMQGDREEGAQGAQLPLVCPIRTFLILALEVLHSRNFSFHIPSLTLSPGQTGTVDHPEAAAGPGESYKDAEKAPGCFTERQTPLVCYCSDRPPSFRNHTRELLVSERLGRSELQGHRIPGEEQIMMAKV